MYKSRGTAMNFYQILANTITESRQKPAENRRKYRDSSYDIF